MTSLFTRFVARGVEVPAVDFRLAAHFHSREVVTEDKGQAATHLEQEEAPAPVQENGQA